MSLKPYISRPQAEAFRSAFDQALQQPNQHPVVFNLWGIGGVGKTTLTRELTQAHQATAKIAAVSFGRTEKLDAPIPLMAELYRQLNAEDWGDPFVDLHNLYQETSNKLQSQPTSGKGEVGEEQIRQVKQLLQLGVDVAGEFFLSESSKKLATTGVERGMEAAVAGLSLKDNLQQWLQQHQATKKDKRCQELMLDPISKLTQAFVQGLSQTARRSPVILVLDTYEKAPLTIDTWLWRTLLSNTDLATHRVRLVIAGRKPLQRVEGWRKFQQDTQAIYDRPLDRFTLEQTVDYLRQIGIDEEQSQIIFQVTKGLPYYLNWIWERRQKGQTLNFAEGRQEIVRLLLQGADEQQELAIQLAACCRWFDSRLIRFLFEQQSLTSDGWFDWLTQQDYVEPTQHHWRLDDVARDAFRLSFWQKDPEQFARVHDLLARYFKGLSDQEVSPNSPPPAKYENADWRELRAEYLYHLLFTKRATVQTQFLTHLLEAHYFWQDAMVQLPLTAITGEADAADLADYRCLSYETRQFLIQIRPAVEKGWAVLEEDPIDYAYNQKKYGFSKTAIDQAVQVCLNNPNDLEGLAKFAALFYKSKRCLDSQRYEWLLQAQTQASQIATSTHPEFSSGLFLWEIGNALSDLGRKEEAISSYDQALHFKPDLREAWYNRGTALSALGRHEEAISSYDQALQLKPDYDKAWYNRGTALSALGRYEEAISSYDQALHFKPDLREAWYNRGTALSDLGRHEEAISSYDQAPPT